MEVEYDFIFGEHSDLFTDVLQFKKSVQITVESFCAKHNPCLSFDEIKHTCFRSKLLLTFYEIIVVIIM